MFLSRVKIPSAISDYEVHQHLHHQFTESDRVFLFRRTSPSDVLMLSIIRPKCEHMELPRTALRAGVPVSFELDAVITRTVDGEKRDVHDPQQRREWLARQLGGAAALRFARFGSRWMRLGNGCRRLVATCTGVLEIADVAEFSLRLQAGFGRTKHLGCGLMWIPEVMP